MKRFVSLAATVLATALFAVRAQAADIVQTAAGNPQFSTLVAAIKAAGLVETLKGAGPFTVFAPTNAAFEKLPKGTVENLLKPENKQQLAALLQYHVVPGRVTSADVVKLKNGATVKTVEGSSLRVTVKPAVRVDNARVVKTDITADNGVIHVIDTVIMPKSPTHNRMGGTNKR